MFRSFIFFLVLFSNLYLKAHESPTYNQYILQKYLRDGASKVAPIEGGSAVYVVGNMGVGKSTLINSLLGYEHIVAPQKLILRGDFPMAAPASDRLRDGVTRFPSAYALSAGGLVFCDTPGYGENTVPSYEWSMELSKSLAKEVKKIIVVFTSNDMEKRGVAFIRLIHTIATLVHEHSLEAIAEHFIFVYNIKSLRSSHDKSYVRNKINELISSYENDLLFEETLNLDESTIQQLSDLSSKLRESYHYVNQDLGQDLGEDKKLYTLSSIIGFDAQIEQLKEQLKNEREEQELLAKRESKCRKIFRKIKKFITRKSYDSSRTKSSEELCLEKKIKETEAKVKNLKSNITCAHRYLEAQICLPLLKIMRSALEDPSGKRFKIWSDPLSKKFRDDFLSELNDPNSGTIPKEALNFSSEKSQLAFNQNLERYITQLSEDLSRLNQLEQIAELKDELDPTMQSLMLFHHSFLKKNGNSFIEKILKTYKDLFTSSYESSPLLAQIPDPDLIPRPPYVVPVHILSSFFSLNDDKSVFLLRNDSHSLRLYFYRDSKEYRNDPLKYRSYFNKFELFASLLEYDLNDLQGAQPDLKFDYVIHRDIASYNKKNNGIVRCYLEVKADKEIRDFYFDEIKKMFREVDISTLRRAIQNSLEPIDTAPDFDGHLAEYQAEEGVDDFIFSII